MHLNTHTHAATLAMVLLCSWPFFKSVNHAQANSSLRLRYLYTEKLSIALVAERGPRQVSSGTHLRGVGLEHPSSQKSREKFCPLRGAFGHFGFKAQTKSSCFSVWLWGLQMALEASKSFATLRTLATMSLCLCDCSFFCHLERHLSSQIRSRKATHKGISDTCLPFASGCCPRHISGGYLPVL